LEISTSLGLWLVECPKENTLPSKFKIQDKHEPRFFQGFGALRRRHQTKRDWRGAKGGERYTFKNLDKKCKQGKCSH
jgi:hypothetical protein